MTGSAHTSSSTASVVRTLAKTVPFPGVFDIFGTAVFNQKHGETAQLAKYTTGCHFSGSSSLTLVAEPCRPGLHASSLFGLFLSPTPGDFLHAKQSTGEERLYKRATACLKRMCSREVTCRIPTVRVTGSYSANTEAGMQMTHNDLLRSVILRVDPVDFVKESMQLVDFIQKLSLNQPIMQPLPAAGIGASGYGGARTPGAQGGEQISFPCPIMALFCFSRHSRPRKRTSFCTRGADPRLICAVSVW